MNTPTKPADVESSPAWPRWIPWTITAIALLLLVLEHRAHVLGWWLHGLLGLCIVLLYLLIRVDGGARRDGEH